jgi:hypothetical protein
MQAKKTWYNGFEYDSRTEAAWAAYFDLLGWSYEPQPEIENDLLYKPDFKIFGPNSARSILAEVKYYDLQIQSLDSAGWPLGPRTECTHLNCKHRPECAGDLKSWAEQWPQYGAEYDRRLGKFLQKYPQPMLLLGNTPQIYKARDPDRLHILLGMVLYPDPRMTNDCECPDRMVGDIVALTPVQIDGKYHEYDFQTVFTGQSIFFSSAKTDGRLWNYITPGEDERILHLFNRAKNHVKWEHGQDPNKRHPKIERHDSPQTKEQNMRKRRSPNKAPIQFIRTFRDNVVTVVANAPDGLTLLEIHDTMMAKHSDYKSYIGSYYKGVNIAKTPISSLVSSLYKKGEIIRVGKVNRGASRKSSYLYKIKGAQVVQKPEPIKPTAEVVSDASDDALRAKVRESLKARIKRIEEEETAKLLSEIS